MFVNTLTRNGVLVSTRLTLPSTWLREEGVILCFFSFFLSSYRQVFDRHITLWLSHDVVEDGACLDKNCTTTLSSINNYITTLSSHPKKRSSHQLLWGLSRSATLVWVFSTLGQTKTNFCSECYITQTNVTFKTHVRGYSKVYTHKC